MENIKNFGNYLTSIFFICLCVFLYWKNEITEIKNVELDNQRKSSEKLTKVYLDRNNLLEPKIDSLQQQNSNLLNKIKDISKKQNNVIVKYNEKIKVINKFAVSDMQSYFDTNFSSK